jgi:hypothetical protein
MERLRCALTKAYPNAAASTGPPTSASCACACARAAAAARAPASAACARRSAGSTCVPSTCVSSRRASASSGAEAKASTKPARQLRKVSSAQWRAARKA